MSSSAVSREEFTAHREQVSRDIEGLASAIREESRQRGHDTSAIRSDIKDLSRRTSVTPHATLIGWAGVILALGAVMGGLYQRGTAIHLTAFGERVVELDRTLQHEIESSEQLSRERIGAARAEIAHAAETAQAASIGRHERQLIEIEELKRRVVRLEARWERAHAPVHTGQIPGQSRAGD